MKIRDPMCFTPLFVLAPARSFSSVTSTMIGMHPEVYGFPELELFRYERVGDLLTDHPGHLGVPSQHRIAGLLRVLAQLHDGRQDDESVARARRWVGERGSWNVSDVFDHLLEMTSPLIGLEKSPESSLRADYLARMDRSYPRARYLHLTRHPVATARSMHSSWSGRKFWELPDELFHQFCLGMWLFQHRRIVRFTSGISRDRGLRIRSEDVLNEPAPTLAAICDWLGVDAGPSAIEAMLHPENSPFAKLGPPGALGGNDPGFLREPTLRQAHLPPSIDIPPDWVVDPWTKVAVAELAGTLGYGRPAS